MLCVCTRALAVLVMHAYAWVTHNEPPHAIGMPFLDSGQMLASASAPAPACTGSRTTNTVRSAVAGWSLVNSGNQTRWARVYGRMCRCVSAWAETRNAGAESAAHLNRQKKSWPCGPHALPTCRPKTQTVVGRGLAAASRCHCRGAGGSQ